MFRDIPAVALVDPLNQDFDRSIAGDGFFDIYLQRDPAAVAVSGGVLGAQTIQALAIDDQFVDYFFHSVEALDQQIVLDFRFIDSPQEADLRIYFDTSIDIPDSSSEILGLALPNQIEGQAPFWEIMLNKPAFSDNVNYLKYALLHELGHTLGLEHPFDPSDGDVFGSTSPWDGNSALPSETVMAYRSPLFGLWSNAFTDNDLRALKLIWGDENVDPLIDGGLLAHDDHHLRRVETIWDEYVHVLALDDSVLSGVHSNSDLDWLFGSCKASLSHSHIFDDENFTHIH